MDIGDKVKLVKGNPFGKIGVIKQMQLMKGPVNLTYDPNGLVREQIVKHFLIETEDGTTFSGTEDDLELIK